MPRSTVISGLLATLLLASTASLGAEDASLGKDLKATIALHGMTCDQIIEAKRNADSDYTAACKDGNRYHVFVNPEGRVVVQKLTP
jgi:hypothetical protein